MEGEPRGPERAETPGDPQGPPADEAVAAFARSLTRHAPFRLEVTLHREICAEAETVLDAFARAVDEVGLRESMSLAGLLARRMAELGGSGVEIGAVIEALVDAIEVVRGRLQDDAQRSLRGIMIEGYTRAAVERERERELRSRITCTRPFVLSRRCVALVLQGSPAPEWIGGTIDGLGPTLMSADASAVVVLARFDEEPSSGAVAELSSVVPMAAVVGARVFYSVPASTVAPLRARVGDGAVILAEDPTEAIARALASAEDSPVRARVAGLLRRFGV